MKIIVNKAAVQFSQCRYFRTMASKTKGTLD